MRNNFRKYRELAHLTQAELAEKLHVSRQSYIHYENGSTEPSFEVLIQISQILHASIDDLLGNVVAPNLDRQRAERLSEEIQEVLERYLSPDSH